VLRITNESKVPAHKPDWRGPDVKARLRDQSFNLYKAVEGPSIRTTVSSDSPAFDTIFFERPVRGADLRLILTVPGKAKDVEIAIKARTSSRAQTFRQRDVEKSPDQPELYANLGAKRSELLS